MTLIYKTPDPSDPHYYHLLELEHCLELEFGDRNKRSSKTKKPWIKCAPPNPQDKQNKNTTSRQYNWGDLDEKEIDKFIQILWSEGVFDTLLGSFCLNKENKDEFLILIKNHTVSYVSKMRSDSFKKWRNRSGGAS